MDFIGNMIGGAIKGATGGFAGNSQPQASAGPTVIAQAGSNVTINNGSGADSKNSSPVSQSPLASSINGKDSTSIGMNKPNNKSFTVTFNDTPTT